MRNAPTSTTGDQVKDYRLKVSRYDRASSMLLAWTSLLGAVVAVMLVLWWTSQIKLGQAPTRVDIWRLAKEDGHAGGDQKLAGPVNEEIDLMEASAEASLVAIAGVVSTKVPMLDTPSLINRTGKGRGGNGRGPGPGGDSDTGSMRPPEIVLPKGLTLDEYAKVLDGLDIELGVLLPGNKVHYAKKLAAEKPITRIGEASKDDRYYLTWRAGELRQADRKLLRRAGIDPKKHLILKFLTAKQESNIVALAVEYAKKQTGRDVDPKNIRWNRYSVRPTKAGGWEFYVIDQRIDD